MGGMISQFMYAGEKEYQVKVFCSIALAIVWKKSSAIHWHLVITGKPALWDKSRMMTRYARMILVACFTVTMLVTCLITTLVTILVLGIGIGYNYCFVDIKTKHRYVPSGYRRPPGKKVPYHPGQHYPGYSHPGPYYPGRPYPDHHYPGHPGRPYPDHHYPGRPYPDHHYPGHPGGPYPDHHYPGHPGYYYTGPPDHHYPGHPGRPYPDHHYPGHHDPRYPYPPGYYPRAGDADPTLPITTTEPMIPFLKLSSVKNTTMRATINKTITENSTTVKPTRTTTKNSTVLTNSTRVKSTSVMMFIRASTSVNTRTETIMNGATTHIETSSEKDLRILGLEPMEATKEDSSKVIPINGLDVIGLLSKLKAENKNYTLHFVTS